MPQSQDPQSAPALASSDFSFAVGSTSVIRLSSVLTWAFPVAPPPFAFSLPWPCEATPVRPCFLMTEEPPWLPEFPGEPPTLAEWGPPPLP